jgi:transposase InsO family protein
MPFRGVSRMDQRTGFVAAARAEESNLRSLCRAYGISRTTGYKWLSRAAAGDGGLADRSRRPHCSPRRTPAEVEAAVIAVRREHPSWGGRKIHHFLRLEGFAAAPHPNTVTDILRRHGLIDPVEAAKHRPFVRFEHDAPNRLWQMDFKGHFAVGERRCHPLTVVDDHSRYAVVVAAFWNEQRKSVMSALTAAFRAHGLPERMLMDNGPPWGTDSEHRHTRLTAWLMRLDIRPRHGKPRHPQTQGKNERFNRTLKAEVLSGRRFEELAAVQAAFDEWRQLYNERRPTKPSAICRRPGASVPPSGPSRSGCRPSSTPRGWPCAAFRSMAASTSPAAPGSSAAPSAASPSPSSRPIATASSTCCSAGSGWPRSTWRRPPREQLPSGRATLAVTATRQTGVFEG